MKLNPNTSNDPSEFFELASNQFVDFVAKVQDDKVKEMLTAAGLSDIDVNTLDTASLRDRGYILLKDALGNGEYKLTLLKIVGVQHYKVNLKIDLRDDSDSLTVSESDVATEQKKSLEDF